MKKTMWRILLFFGGLVTLNRYIEKKKKEAVQEAVASGVQATGEAISEATEAVIESAPESIGQAWDVAISITNNALSYLESTLNQEMGTEQGAQVFSERRSVGELEQFTILESIVPYFTFYIDTDGVYQIRTIRPFLAQKISSTKELEATIAGLLPFGLREVFFMVSAQGVNEEELGIIEAIFNENEFYVTGRMDVNMTLPAIAEFVNEF